MKKLVLIDGNSLLNRAFYATPVFTTKDGNPTNAIFGFVKLMFKIINDLKPEYMVVAFDLKAPTFRHKLYSDYKAGRKPMPEELAIQLEPLKNLLNEMKIATCSKEGIEADDIIGTLSAKFDVHSYIYTGDRDSYQLVDDKTDVYYTKRGVSDLLKLTKENFVDEIGLTPCQIVDLKALMGDKSDNIPGIPGVGEKTAVSLLEKYKSVDGIYNHIDEIKGTLKDKLIANKDSMQLSYTLATINRNCDLDVKLENCTVPHKYSMSVKKLFNRFEFRSLQKLDVFEEEDYSLNTEITYPKIVYCNSLDEFRGAINGESLGIEFNSGVLSIYNGDKQYCVKESEDLFGEGFSCDDMRIALKLIFEQDDFSVITYDAKSIMRRLCDYEVEFKCKFDDVSLMIYLCDYAEINATFSAYCELSSYDYTYASYVVKLLFNSYIKKINAENLHELYYDIELPLVNVLFAMENDGVRISLNELKNLSEKYTHELKYLTETIYKQCGQVFNINSATQLGDILFNKMGLKAGKKGKNGKYSTSAEVLEKLESENPVIRNILLYRLYYKLYSTYVEGIKPLIRRSDTSVHTTYNQTVTATGRLSSANPNLQNIPIREDEGRELRKMFVPRDGNVFIDADYSQIELRLLAHFSKCQSLIDAFNNGADIHTVTASQVFDVAPEEVTASMRRTAKIVNFGVIYGISDFGLSKTLNVSVRDARAYIDKYFAKYKQIKEYMQSNVDFAKENGYVTTLTGRRRIIREINSPNYNLRQFGERVAMNMPLQGSSADIIKIAMINVDKALKDKGLKTKLILQVHDELVLDAPEDEVDVATEILKNEMENAVKLSVPLTVDVHAGKNWYEAK